MWYGAGGMTVGHALYLRGTCEKKMGVKLRTPCML